MSSMKGRIFLRGNKSLQRFSAGFACQTRNLGAGLALLLLSACGTSLPEEDQTGRHIPAPADPTTTSDIPQVVTPLPLLEPPQPETEPFL